MLSYTFYLTEIKSTGFIHLFVIKLILTRFVHTTRFSHYCIRHHVKHYTMFLSTFTTDSPSKLDIFWHNGHSFCVQCTQVSILQQTNNVGFTGPLQLSLSQIWRTTSLKQMRTLFVPILHQLSVNPLLMKRRRMSDTVRGSDLRDSHIGQIAECVSP